MAEPENRIFCRLDQLTPAVREQKRLAAIRNLDLLDAETVGVFDEATQTIARLLNVPICILSVLTSEQQLIKSAVGLSRVGLMNELAQLRQLPRSQSFCTYVVDSHQVLAIQDTITNSVFANSTLVSYYGIRAYLGAPLLTANGQCIGTLAVMDFVPRSFSSQEHELLAITARWSLSEFERNQLLKQQSTQSSYWWLNPASATPSETTALSDHPEHPWQFSSTNTIKLKLLTELTQELRRPLTSIMGMASVLNRQIYGSLTSKQKEYLEIIHHSGEHLVSLIEEIIALGVLDQTSETLHLTSVDIAMLCQQSINSLSQTAQQHQQQIRLSVEPGSRIWLLDKEKVRQILYYLLFSLIESAVAGSEVRIHVSRKSDLDMGLTPCLQIAVWISHPWLGDGLGQIYGDITESPLPLTTPVVSNVSESPKTSKEMELWEVSTGTHPLPTPPVQSTSSVLPGLALSLDSSHPSEGNVTRENLGLLLSCQLAELHGGQISVQGLSESGYRYVIRLPQLKSAEEKL